MAGAGGTSAVGGSTSVGGTFDCRNIEERCAAAPPGNSVAYSNEQELSSLIGGAWLRCSGSGYPTFGVGVLISADHTWNSITVGSDGSCVPVTKGFTDYGTWVTNESAGHLQFNLLKVDGGGAAYFPAISDTDRLLLDPGARPTEYVRAPIMN